MGAEMKRAYGLGLILISIPSMVLGDVPGDEKRYHIYCTGHQTIDNELPDSESFNWIVDEGAPANEQIFNLGKSICEGMLSCKVEVRPNQIRIRTVGEKAESGRILNLEIDGTIDRVYGTAQMTGSLTETRGKLVKRHTLVGTYSCERLPLKRVI